MSTKRGLRGVGRMGGVFGLSFNDFFRLIMKLTMAIDARNFFQIDNVTHHGQVYCTLLSGEGKILM